MTPFILHTRSPIVIHLFAVGLCLLLLQFSFTKALDLSKLDDPDDDDDNSEDNQNKEDSKADSNTPSDEFVSPPGTPASLEIESSSSVRLSPSRPPVTTEPTPTSSTAQYRLLGSSGGVCILLRVDALLSFHFKTMSGEERDKDIFLPETAKVSGECISEDQARMLLHWKSYVLAWYFAKTPGGERWYVEKIDLSFDTSENIFEHYAYPGRMVRLTTPKEKASLLFPTPVGKSYLCSHTETSVDLVPKEGMPNAKQVPTATLLLRDFKLQPFIFKNDEFGPEYVCTPGGSGFRDETAPIAVGSTFAIVVLLTVAGYGVYRHFKVKKVQYDTME
ncbi:lysosome-associated membrane glycoprotein 5-like [Hetaerina americana]|uniref:lysosome-associated membrane glycoprotein 5-like n=1 Tax=Hetaerina americana TaxID=62018 RepID=UPI003A7F5BAF